jgi:hypothetical protein
VIVTVSGALLAAAESSVTLRLNTSVADVVVAGAVNVGICAEALLNVTGGPELCVHAYDAIVPSVSALAAPVNVTTAPELTVWSGPALAVGGEFCTVTVAAALVLPPEPEHDSVKVVVSVSAPVDAEPDVACVPLQPPEAVHVVAWVLVQVSVVAWLRATDATAAVNVTVGAGGGLPPPPLLQPTSKTATQPQQATAFMLPPRLSPARPSL